MVALISVGTSQSFSPLASFNVYLSVREIIFICFLQILLGKITFVNTTLLYLPSTVLHRP